jgi:hypothetical protein
MFQPGPHLAQLVSSVLGMSSKNKSPQVVLTWQVIGVAENGDWAAVTPEEVRMYLSLSGGAAPITEAMLVSLGFNGDFANPQFGTQATQDGIQIDAFLDTYQGKTSLKWRLPSTGGAVEPAPDSVVRQVQAQWNQRHRPIQRPAAQPVKTATPKPAARPAAPPQSPGLAEDGEPLPPEPDGVPTGEQIPF